jgi:hypothetical protein
MPILWQPLLNYLSDQSRSNEIKLLFISRYINKNKNKLLINTVCSITILQSIDLNTYIKEVDDRVFTMIEIESIIESVFYLKPARFGWKYSEEQLKMVVEKFLK